MFLENAPFVVGFHLTTTDRCSIRLRICQLELPSSLGARDFDPRRWISRSETSSELTLRKSPTEPVPRFLPFSLSHDSCWGHLFAEAELLICLSLLVSSAYLKLASRLRCPRRVLPKNVSCMTGSCFALVKTCCDMQ